jgi:hypothetical protein
MPVPPNFQVEVNGELMTVTVTGVLRADDVVAVVREYYPTFRGGQMLWDLGAVDSSGVQRADLVRIALAALDHTPSGVSRKTAYVVSGQNDYLLIWKYLNEVMQVRVPVEYQAFTDVATASRWLKES